MKGKRQNLSLIILLALVTVPLFMVSEAEAQTAPATILSYAAKFVCGPATVETDVVFGTYASTINVHNPNFLPVKFRKKAVIALPESSPANGPISQKRDEALNPDEAMGVNCRDIRLLFSGISLPPHIEGFLVIEVPRDQLPGVIESPELDVVGKYTARHRGPDTSAMPFSGDVVTLDIEEVHPKRVPCIPGIACPP